MLQFSLSGYRFNFRDVCDGYKYAGWGVTESVYIVWSSSLCDFATQTISFFLCLTFCTLLALHLLKLQLWHTIIHLHNTATHSGQSSAFTTPKSTSIKSHTQLNMAKISSVKAREILDSRGNPTVEVCYICILYDLSCVWDVDVYMMFVHKICFNSQTIASSSFYLP